MVRVTQPDHADVRPVWLSLVLIVGLLVNGCGQGNRQECQANLSLLWEAAGSYCVDRRAVPAGAIDPRDLKEYLRDRKVPRCPLGNDEYASFRLFEGPRCPHEGSGHTTPSMPRKVFRIKQATQ